MAGILPGAPAGTAQAATSRRTSAATSTSTNAPHAVATRRSTKPSCSPTASCTTIPTTTDTAPASVSPAHTADPGTASAMTTTATRVPAQTAATAHHRGSARRIRPSCPAVARGRRTDGAPPAPLLWRHAFRLEDLVAQLLILTSQVDGDALPALALLGHRVRTIPAEPAQLVNAPHCDAILVDARSDLA